MMKWLLFIVLPILASGQTNSLLTQTCTRDNSATIQDGADAWLGGIISLNAVGTGGYGCGESIGSMQGYEAMRWVLDLLNKKNEKLNGKFLNDTYVPGIKLGMKVRNYCSNTNTAVAAVGDVFEELGGGSSSCTQSADRLTFGTVGASSSGATYDILDATLPFNIPVISYEATAPQLTTSRKYDNFQRTVSPDGPLTEVIVKVLVELKWDYIAVVYDQGSYGRAAYSELHNRMVAAGICLTAGVMVDASDVSDDNIDSILNQVANSEATGVIFIGPNSFPKPLIERADTRLPATGSLQWLFMDFPLYQTFENLKYQRGVISVTVASRHIVEFEDHWIRIDPENPSNENPWFQSWYEEINNCAFTATPGKRTCSSLFDPNLTAEEKELQRRRDFQQDQYVESAVMAVFTYARGLRDAQMALCGAPGLCSALRNLKKEDFVKNYLRKVDFTFTSDERVPSLASNNVQPYNAIKTLKFNGIGDIGDPSYYIWNYNNIEPGAGANVFKFRRIGSFINNYLDLNLNNVGMYDASRGNRLLPLPSSPCPARGCSPCLGLPADVKYYFENGDLVINGIFSLHNMGITPLTCGALSSANRAQYLEAMIYAIKRVNDNNILSNIRLGGLGIDDCSSATLSQAFVTQVQRGNLEITDSSGKPLDPRTIEAYTGAYTSPQTIPLAAAMNTIERPLVGYRAVSSELDDQRMYPYYIRSLPGIREEMKALILLLKRLDWSYVQLVTSSHHYSMDAEKVFKDLAAREGICVVATHDMRMVNDQNHVDQTVRGLGANSNVPVVISLLEKADNREFLKSLSRNMDVRSKITLIATTTWCKKLEVVEGFEEAAKGVITLSLQRSPLQGFWEYLRQLRVGSHTLNPWFEEWFAMVHNCSMGGSSGALPACDISKPISDGVLFKQMSEVESVLNGVEAIARGLDATLRRYCGNSYTSVCSAFINSPNKGLAVVDEILKVTFNLEGSIPTTTFSFSERSAVMPFVINNYKIGPFRYVKVGDVNPWTSSLTLTPSEEIVLFNGESTGAISLACPQPCLACLYMSRYLDYMYIPGDLVIGAIFDAHYIGDGPFMCGARRPENGAFYSEIFKFVLDDINSGNSGIVQLNNVRLGGLAFDGCSNPSRATAIVNKVHTDLNIMDGNGNRFMPSQLMTWITYDSQTTIDTALLVQQLGLPIVSPGATAVALNDKKKFNTFFRTIPSDSVVVKGMAQFANFLGWKFVIVLNSPDLSSRQARDAFREYLAGFGICVVASYEFETDGNMEVILRSMSSANTDVVAVIAEPDQYIDEFLTYKMNNRFTYPKDFRFIANRPWKNPGGRYSSVLADSVFFQMNYLTNQRYMDYIRNQQVLNGENPWFDQVYEEYFNCNLPGSFNAKRSPCDTSRPIVTASGWTQDIWTMSTINAVYIVAAAIRSTLIDKCGPGYQGVCAQFTHSADTHEAIMRNMDSLKFTSIDNMVFQFIEREANSMYKLMRYTSGSEPLQEGTLSYTGDLDVVRTIETLTDLYSGVQSSCLGDCLVCQPTDTNLQDFTLVQGDVYIVGLFDIHKAGDSPFTCGPINDKHGLPLLEAFKYAIELINNKTDPFFRNILEGVQLGGIGLDTCQSPTRAANLVANIHSGNIKLVRGSSTINPRRIDAYVATMDTESSIRVADILTQLSIPQISYGATGIELLDREKYDYFLRTVPADDKQARAIVSILKKFNYNNIQVINSFDEVGEPGMEEFKRLALVNEICIKKTQTLDPLGDPAATPTEIVRTLGSPDNRDAEVVVLWMKNPVPILEAANDNSFVRKNVLFIVTDKWGANPDFLKNPKLQDLWREKNVLTLDVETADIPGFDKYLEHKTPDNYNGLWFKEYLEMAHSCSWDGASGTPCDKSETLPRFESYIQDPYTLYVTNAVFSAALGINHALKVLCNKSGQNYGACNLYRTSGERRQRVMDGLKEVNFVDDTHQPFFFTEDGQSDRGFHIYNVTTYLNTPNVFHYENVGHYNDTHFLKLDITYNSRYDASCDAKRNLENVDDCVCPFPVDLPTRFMKKEEGGRGLALVYVGDIHKPHPTNKLACGAINTGVDLQKLLAFFYAIESVNSNINLNRADSIRLDGLALDSCGRSVRLGQDVYNVLSGNPLCDSDERGQVISPSDIVAFVVDKDHNAIPISNMLRDHGITTISPTAGSALLNDRFYHPYFLRITGGDVKQGQIILELAREAGWDLVNVIYTDSLSQRGAKDALLSVLSTADTVLCVTEAVPLSVNATLRDAVLALERISQQVGVGAVVLFVEPAHMALLMEASAQLVLAGRYVWIVPSNWAHSGGNLGNNQQEAVGSLMIEDHSAILKDFNDYVNKLNFHNRGGIPDDWFEEIYQNLHKCNIINLQSPSTRQYSAICSEDELIGDKIKAQDPAVLRVIMAVFSVAHGLNRIIECDTSTLDVAACLQLQEERSDLIYRNILGVDFKVLPDLLGQNAFQFSFDLEGNGEAGYLIRNYQDDDGDSGNYTIKNIGRYTSQGLNIDLSQFKTSRALREGEIPTSKCVPGTTCKCLLPYGRIREYTSPGFQDITNVQVGGRYEDPDTGKPIVVKSIPDAGDRFEDTWAIIVTILAIIGVCVSLGIFVYLLIMYPVRGGTSILGFILSFGIVLLYLMVLAFVAYADERICALRRFGLGFVYAIVYSSLLVKLVDCWRIRGKAESYDAKYSKLGRPMGLFLVTVFLVLVQVMINTEWLILEKPGMERFFYNDMYYPRCTPGDFYDEGLVLSLCYIMALIVFGFLLGLITFTATKNHRESRWILGILILSIPCWVIWCSVAVLGERKVRDAAVAVGLLINATVMLLLVPVRKLYLLHKYNVLIDEEEEEERQSHAPGSSHRGDYSTYGRQYDNNPRLQDGSTHGSTRGYPTPRSHDGSGAY